MKIHGKSFINQSCTVTKLTGFQLDSKCIFFFNQQVGVDRFKPV